MNQFEQIIALKGKGDSGKTTVLLKVIMQLEQLHDWEVMDCRTYGIDRCVVFIKIDIVIAVTTRGDTYDALKEDFEWLLNHNPVLCICAARSFDRTGKNGKKGTHAAIKKWSALQAVFLKKTTPKNDTSKDKDVKALLSKLSQALIKR